MSNNSNNTGVRAIWNRMRHKTDLVVGYEDGKEVINACLESILEEIYEGRRVQIQGFGIFDSTLQGPRTIKPGIEGMSPKKIEAFWRPTFKFSKPFKKKMGDKQAFWE